MPTNRCCPDPEGQSPSIVLVGSGNVATALALALDEQGLCPKQIYSPSAGRAAGLCAKLSGKTQAIEHIQDICTDADLYLIAISDRAISEFVHSLPNISGVIAHTAGSVSIEELSPVGEDVGVLYPLLTFSLGRPISFDHLPIYIEASSAKADALLGLVAHRLSDRVYRASGTQRGILHLAAVFVCNFVNHFYAIGEHLLADAGLDASALFPLIAETAAKVQTLAALNAQTGPAVRMDEPTMKKHLSMLSSDPHLADLYRQVSASIVQSKLKTNRE